MKKSKLLFLMPIFAAGTILPIVSCNNVSEGEKIANAIFNPADLDPTKPIESPVKNNFYESLKTLNKNEIKNELIYDLFIKANVKSGWLPDLTLKQLYKDNKVILQFNITKAEMKFEDNKIFATFLGYVSFVFTKDIDNTDYKVNDYIMITYDFKDLELNQEEWGLEYSDSCIGFYKYRTNGGEKEWLESIPSVRTKYYSSLPPNSHNWGTI